MIGADSHAAKRLRFKRSQSWSEGQRVEDEVVKRSKELLQKLNRRTSDLAEADEQVRSSLEEVHLRTRRIVRSRSCMKAIQEAAVEFDTKESASVDEENRSTPQVNTSYSPNASSRNVRLESTSSSNGDLVLSSSKSSLVGHRDSERVVDQPIVEGASSLPPFETDGIPPRLKELYEVKCEQETSPPSCHSKPELVIGFLHRFKFLSQFEEMVAFPSSKTYTDLSTTLTDEADLWV